MRVVAGSARGRRLVAPAGTATRPTSDRAREGIFNMVSSRMSLDGVRVADLFAGSGAMGIEALSRGAAHVTFVEHDRRAIESIRTNLETLGFENAATVVTADVMAWAARRATAGGSTAGGPAAGGARAARSRAGGETAQGGGAQRPRGGDAAPFDVVFADPPYAFDEWSTLAAAVADCELFIAESDRPAGLGAGWGLLTERRYGGTVVVLASPSRKVSS